MKLPTATSKVEVSGGSTASTFSIAMNAKAFRVLSDTLYTNKIGSIVREISCNGTDGHIMAKKVDVPIVIHLPDAFEPYFTVKDFGVGLSESDITSVFTVYFESTKDQSNDTVGAFGLGAKTPFSYTDQFTVTSTHGGFKRTYSAYIAEHGMPTIVQMDSVKCGEPNGVEITMSVKSQDFKRFADEVRSQLRFFPVKPVIQNCHNFAFDDVGKGSKVIIDNKDFTLYDGSNNFNANAVQGNVGYQISVGELQKSLSPTAYNVLNNIQYRSNLKFNIGEIGVTASREGIEYTAHTIAMFEKKLINIGKDISKYVNAQLTQFTNEWDKIAFVNNNSMLMRLVGKNTVVDGGIAVSYSNGYAFSLDKLLQANLTTMRVWNRGRTVRESSAVTYVVPSVKEKVCFVIRDTMNRANMKAKHVMADGAYAKVYEVSAGNIDDLTDAFIAKLKVALGGFADIKRLSEVVLPERVKDANGTYVRTSYSRPTCYIATSYTSYVRGWEKGFDDLKEVDEPSLYIVVADMSCDNVIEQLAKLQKIVDDVPTVYGIRESDLKKIENNDNFVAVADYVDLQRKKFSSDKKLYAQCRNVTVKYKIGKSLHRYNSLALSYNEFTNVVDSRNAFLRLLNIVNNFRDSQDVSNNAKLFATGEFMKWNFDKVADKRVFKVEQFVTDSVAKRYPLIDLYVNNWSLRSLPIEHLALYIERM